ncbi:MAG: aminotransferase class V-fold PLP-dependent enzyme [Flavobacteriaceae bacterium]
MHSDSFPLLTNQTYLNTAYVGLMSSALARHRSEQDESYVKLGPLYKAKAYESLDTTHHLVGQFFGSQPQNSFVVHNFSHGIRQALSFLPKDAKVLLLEDDYPSLCEAFRELHFPIQSLKQQPDLEESIEQVLSTSSIDILALSIVQYTTGMLIDFDFLKKIKEKFPRLIIMGDGTQFLGAHSFQFDESPFDVVAASGYKWMLAGFGNGILMVSQDFLEFAQIQTKHLYDRIFNGHFNLLATSSLHFAINQLVQADFSKLMYKKEALSIRAKEELTETRFLAPWVATRKKHSSIFSLLGGESLYRHLKENKIDCIQRGEGVRVSFHFYNNESDLAALMEALAHFK